MAGDEFCETFCVPANLAERVLDQGVPRYLDDCFAPEVSPDLLHLLRGDAVHVDKPDQRVLLCVLLDRRDLVLFPCGQVVGIDCHYTSLTDGPIVVFT